MIYFVVLLCFRSLTAGFIALKWVGIVMCTSISFAVLTPRLRSLSIQRSYSSPIDFITDRYHSETLRLLIAMCLFGSNLIYIAGQFSAISDLVQTITEDQIPGYAGAIFMGVVILALEALGGLKSVMLTDTLQSIIMILSFIIVPLLLTEMYGTFVDLLAAEDCGSTLQGQCGLNQQPEVFKTYPTTEQSFTMGSNMLGFLSYAVLPQCVHRIYTAGNVDSLKTTITLLPVTAYLTMISGIFIGLVCAARLNEDEDSTAFGIVSGELYDRGGFKKVMGSVMMCGGLAAISSTADSALIALSHIASEDIYKGKYFPAATPKEIVLFSKLCSLLGVALCISFIFLPSFDVSKAAQLQSGTQIQALPAFFFGLFPELFTRPPSSRSLIYGFVVSIVVLFLVEFGVHRQGISVYLAPGIWGFLCQVVVIFVMDAYGSQEYLSDHVRQYDQPPAGVVANFPTITAADGSKVIRRLQTSDIDAVAKLDASEPFGSRNKRMSFVVMLVLLFGGLPWYGSPDAATPFTGGWPNWAIVFLSLNSVVAVMIMYLLYQWIPAKEGAGGAYDHSAAGEELEVSVGATSSNPMQGNQRSQEKERGSVEGMCQMTEMSD
jgi:Na+/proline symporter